MGAELRNFDLPLEGEFVRKLVGELDEEDVSFEGLGAIVATDSVAFKAETDLGRVAEVLGMMLSEVLNRSVKNELQFVDSLEPLRSKSAIVDQLEFLLASKVFEGMDRSLSNRLNNPKVAALEECILEFSPPDGISIKDVDRIEIHRGTSQDDSVRVLESMTFVGLRAALADFGKKFGKTFLKDMKLIARGQDGEPASQMQPLKNWLIFESGKDNDPLKGRTLFLGINDDGFHDNSGYLAVLVDEMQRSKDAEPPTYHYDPANGWIPGKD
jgi:uncharacterized protein (TIGR04141 family)